MNCFLWMMFMLAALSRSQDTTKKILMRCAVYYDQEYEDVANLVVKTLDDFTITEGLTEDFVVDATLYEQESTKDFASVLSSGRYTTVIVASQTIDCESLSSYFQLIPFFYIVPSTGNCDADLNYNRIHYLMPTMPSIMWTFLQIVQQYGWDTIGTIFKQNREVFFTFDNIEKARDSGIDVLPYEAKSGNESVRALLDARRDGVRTFAVACSFSQMLPIFQAAQKLELLTENYYWFIPNVILENNIIRDYLHHGMYVTFLYSPIITPLTMEILNRYPDISSNEMIYTIVRVLVRVLARDIASACRDQSASCLPIITHNGVEVAFCGAIPEEEEYDPLAHKAESWTFTPLSTDGKEATPIQYHTGSCLLNNIELSDLSSSVDVPTEGVKGATIDISHFTLYSSFDACQFLSNYVWNYNVESCSSKFLNHLHTSDSNALYVVEHKEKSEDLVVVGCTNNARDHVNIIYPEISVHVQLPHRRFRVGVLWNPPWMMWDIENAKPVPGSYRGYLFDVLTEVSLIMNFTFEILHESALLFGPAYEFTEETIEPTLNEFFENDTFDIFLYDMVVMGDRMTELNTVSVTSAVQTPLMYLLMKRVELTGDAGIWQFLAPFTSESWVALWASFLFVSLLIAYINKRNPYEFKKAVLELPPGSKKSDHLGILNSMWFNFASLVEQSSQLLPNSASLKVMTGFWWLFVNLVVASYTANMISFMTQVDVLGVTSLSDLVSQQEQPYGMLYDNPLLTKFLPRATQHPYTAMWTYVKKHRKTAKVANITVALDRILHENFILVASYKTVVRALERSCEFNQVGDGNYQYHVGIPVRKAFIYLPAINANISVLRDRGILDQLQKKWFGDLEEECESETSSGQQGQLRITAFLGMYVFLLMGLIGGFIICLWETGRIKYGGMHGFAGKAQQYNFRKDHRALTKPESIMESEFSKWQGGWEIMKHRPFISLSEIQNAKGSKTVQPSSLADSSTNSGSMKPTEIPRFCPDCGQVSEPSVCTKAEKGSKRIQNRNGKKEKALPIILANEYVIHDDDDGGRHSGRLVGTLV